MKKMFAAALVALLACIAPALAQVQTQPVFTPKSEFFNVIASASRVPATYNSLDFTVGYGRGVICSFNQTANTPTPSTTVALQEKDPISGSYFTIATTAAITTTNATAGVTQAGVFTYPGFAGSPPTGFVGSALPATRTMRVQMVVGGTGASTGTVNCATLP
jgi:hypothetical protein